MNVRSPERDEAEAVAELLNAHARAVYGKNDTSEAEIRVWFDNPDLDLERDVWVAVEDGQLVGYADVADWGRTRTSFWLDLRAHPATGGTVIPPLLALGEGRVGEWTAESPDGERLTLRAVAHESDSELRDVLELSGYRAIRYSFRMEIELESPPPEPQWPDGIALRRLAPGEDGRAVLAAVNDAFADTWEYVPNRYDEWSHFWFESETFDPELWILAFDRDEIAAVSLCQAYRSGDPELGWVSTLGVRRPWRRRGLGRALLVESFRAFHDRGLRRVGLGVDAENPTGATRLYESAGMRVSQRFSIWEKELRPGTLPR